ncbi:MAG: hypothetical protein RAO92_01620 [Candidatus Euphemobacter frigidus]|nr:hypothetical protein [Candidatus Euphemobacter frigidus]MDP8275080.1 hypothetical protein [Candidatus Euphemobacter frigidus]
MNKMVLLLVLAWGGAFISLGLVQGTEGEAGPQELNRKAYFLVREAKKAIFQKEERKAYDRYIEAEDVYKMIAERFPDWQAPAIRTKIEECKEQSETIGRKIFKLPKGYVEIRPGMTREGKRYDDGSVIAPKVKKIGDNQYEVEKFTVTLVRAGPLLGASCTGPDYTYRGRKHGFACKHIWAVIHKENLLRK